MIRAVIFDWGGVLQRTEDPAPRRELERELGMAEGALERAVFDHPLFEQASLGRVGADEAWLAAARAVGWPEAKIDEFVERFFAGDRIDERLVDLVRWWRIQGLRVGLLSNAPRGRTQGAGVAGRWGLDGVFDAQVFSHQVGAFKPDPRMYRAILAALQVAPQDALFVDDMEANVAGARALGIHAVRFHGYTELLADLEALRLPLPPHVK